MIVRDFMTPDPVTAAPETSIHDALASMEHHGVRHLPVVLSGKMVGVVSDRDLVGQAGTSFYTGGGGKIPKETRIEEVMKKDVITANPMDPVVAVAVELSAQGIGCLPVLEDGKLVGIVSETDLLRLVSELKDGPQVVTQSIGAMGAGVAVTANLEATVKQLDELMSAKGIRHVPITSDGQVVGMVSDRDMRRAGWTGLHGTASAGEIMSKGVISVPATDTVQQAARTMSERRISALVTESGEGTFGIVTSTDLLEFALGALQ